MRTFPIAALVLALGATTTLLPAQPGRGASRADRGAIARGAPAGMAPAEALLRQRARLVLSDEQVQRLEALAATQRAARPASPGQALRLRADLLDAMAGDGNPQAARAALDRISAQRNEQLVAGMRARQEARAVLTPAQRTRADALGQRGVRERMAGQFAGRRFADRGRGAGMRPGAVGRGEGRPGVRGPRPGQAGPRGAVPPGVTPRGERPRGERPRGERPRGDVPRGPAPRPPAPPTGDVTDAR